VYVDLAVAWFLKLEPIVDSVLIVGTVDALLKAKTN